MNEWIKKTRFRVTEKNIKWKGILLRWDFPLLCLMMLLALFFIWSYEFLLPFLLLSLRHRNKIYIVCIPMFRTRGLQSVYVDLWCLQLIWIGTDFSSRFFFHSLFVLQSSFFAFHFSFAVYNSCYLFHSLAHDCLARFLASAISCCSAPVNCLKSNSEIGFKLFMATWVNRNASCESKVCNFSGPKDLQLAVILLILLWLSISSWCWCVFARNQSFILVAYVNHW